MIGTIAIKQEQLTKGYYSIGTGNELILIIGSCRSVPYLNYLNDWNQQNNNRFSICFIDPFNWNWDINDSRVSDYHQELAQQEKNETLLSMLRSTTIFIHEYYANAGMFNCNKLAEKNIYQYGLNPTMDICIPNFNDIFILTRDIVSFDMEIRKKSIADYNVIGKLSERTLIDIDKVRDCNLEKFYNICVKTDFPEFAEIFKNNYKRLRYFHTFNHVSKHFTLAIFQFINDRFLHLDFSHQEISQLDLYDSHYTKLCEYDKQYTWHEEIIPLKISL